MLSFDDREWFTARCRGLDIKKAKDRKFIKIQCQCLGISYTEGCKILGVEAISPIVMRNRLTNVMKAHIDAEPDVASAEWKKRFGKYSPSFGVIQNYRLKMGYIEPKKPLWSEDATNLLKSLYNDTLLTFDEIAEAINDEFGTAYTMKQVQGKISYLTQENLIVPRQKRGIYVKSRKSAV